MKIYVAHSRGFDYKNELYKPIRECDNLKNYEIILPHESDEYSYHGRDFYKNVDLYICEVSFPATGLGMELAFAYDENKPIYCIYKKGNKFSSSIKSVTDKIIEYDTTDQMDKIIEYDTTDQMLKIIEDIIINYKKD